MGAQWSSCLTVVRGWNQSYKTITYKNTWDWISWFWFCNAATVIIFNQQTVLTADIILSATYNSLSATNLSNGTKSLQQKLLLEKHKPALFPPHNNIFILSLSPHVIWGSSACKTAVHEPKDEQFNSRPGQHVKVSVSRTAKPWLFFVCITCKSLCLMTNVM